MLKIYGKDKKYIKPLINFSGLAITEEIGVLSTVEFTTPKTDILEVEGYIETPTDRFVIKEIKEENDEIKIFGIGDAEELQHRKVWSYECNQQTVRTAVAMAMQEVPNGTWGLNDMSGATRKRTLNLTKTTVWNILMEIQKLFYVELKFDTKTKSINIYDYKGLGEDKGAYFINGLNLESLATETDSKELATMIFARGKNDITFDENASISNSMTGQRKGYVYDFTYTGKHIQQYWVDERYTDKDALLQDAKYLLADMCVPKINYTVKVRDLANSSLGTKYQMLDYKIGDMVTVFKQPNSTEGANLKQRIVKLKRYPFEIEKSTCELSTKRKNFADIQALNKKFVDNIKQSFDNDGKVNNVADDSIKDNNIKDDSVTGNKIKKLAIGTAHIDNASITSAKIANASIQNAHIKDGEIDRAKIKDASIGTAQIEDATITGAKIGTAQIDTAHIINGAIENAQIADASITKAKIGDAQIGTAQIEDASITKAKIGVGQIDTAHIGLGVIDEARIEDGAITNAKIYDGAITNAKIENGCIDNAKIEDATITGAKIADASITVAKIKDLDAIEATIGDLSVTNAKIANGAITNAKIEDATITGAKIALGTIDTALIGESAIKSAQIADASITDAKIVELSASKLTAGTIDASKITVNNLHADNITTGTINGKHIGELGTEHLEDGAVTGNKIDGATITPDKIVANSITAGQIASKTITANEILANTITGAEVKADTIEGRHIKGNTIEGDKIKAGSLTAGAFVSEVQEGLSQVGEVPKLIEKVDSVESAYKQYTDFELQGYQQSMQQYLNYDSTNGLVLGAVDSQFKTAITNDRINFKDGKNNVAYVSKNKFNIENGEVRNELRIGNFAFKPNVFNGNMTIVWEDR